jgi:small subunit ribosomal protein S17
MPDQQTIEQRAAERAERRAKMARARRAYRAKQKQKRGEPGPAKTPPSKEHGPGRPKVRQGVVTSAKPDKTITVRIDVTRRHRMYKKIVRESTTLHVHDESNDAHEGDLVRIVESRPISRLKRWRLVEVVERSR